MSELFGAGGKRLRPALVLLFGKLGAYDFGRLKHGAMGVEFVHASTLVHDDVIDRSPTRRGRSTIAASRGHDAAILIGDYYFAKAYREAAATGRAEVVAELAAAVATMSFGELEALADMRAYHRRVGRYLEHITWKTGALMAAACRIGAVLAGLDEPGANAASAYGSRLGTAFQIVDDVLDYTGEPEEVGKPVGHDLLEGSATLPLLLAFETAQRSRLEELLPDGRSLDREAVEAVVDLVRECGAPALAMQHARRWSANAVEALAELPDSEARKTLAALATYVVERTT
jgi:geranylgeranyl pyrophosphate synthase